MGFAFTPTEWIDGILDLGVTGTLGENVVSTLNCGNPLSGDELGAKW